ncbi:MAG TPA: efflux RND transporter periplasmic adaptor subunit [Deltaproteobacteria bacterium]|nr:efflux RND transporter periplasmic adaptor subunit [Deltaproteobacteria bacterium]
MKWLRLPVVFSLTLILLTACGNTAPPEPRDNLGSEPSKPQVFVTQVTQGSVLTTYTIAGTVLPEQTARITSKVPGRITRVSVEAGDRVSQGDLLMLIDPVDYERQYENSTALMNQARVTLERVQRDLARIETLYAREAVSEQSYQDAKTARDLAQFQYDQAVSAWKMAGQNLKESRISAPMAGIITDKFVNEGELIGTQAPAFVIVQMDTVKIEVDLPERLFGSIHMGGQGLLTVDAFPEESFAGTITRIHPTIDPVSRTFRMTITVDNPALKLRSGMTARVQVVQTSRENILAVPKSSIILGENRTFVYRVVDETIQRVEIRLGIEGDTVFEVLDGLVAGDWVVTRGITGLTDGMKIRSIVVQSTTGE